MKYPLTICNNASSHREGWTEQIAVPLMDGIDKPIEATFVTDAGVKFRAVRGEDVGVHSATYRIRAAMNGDEWLDGYLVDQPHPDAKEPYAMHPWVLDDVKALIPRLAAVDQNGTESQGQLIGFGEVSSSPAHVRVRIRFAIPWLGLIQEIWADVTHKDPVIPFFGKVVWSDRKDRSRTRWFTAVGMEAGEHFAVDFASIYGFPYYQRNGGLNTIELLSRQAILDGGCVPFSGRVLACDGPPPRTDKFTLENWNEVRNLEAARRGPMTGVCRGWDGRFLGAGNVQALENPELNLWLTRGGVAQARGLGLGLTRPGICTQTPYQTGDQPDFGAQKASEALLGNDPRWTYWARMVIQGDMLRGVHHYESDGSILQAANHPEWETWGQRSGYWFWDGVIGKDGGWWPGNPIAGWEGYDDEHYSQNTLAAYLALTGDPLVANHLEHQSQVDAAAAFTKRGWTAATRAEGRRSQVFAQLSLVTSGAANVTYRELLNQRIALNLACPGMNVSGPVKVPAWHEPIGSKPLFDDQGNLVSTWTVWELGLYLVGFYIALKSKQASDLPGLQRLLTIASVTMAEQGCFQEGGAWFICSDLEYRPDGQPIVLSKQKRNVAADSNPGDVREWTTAGLCVAREWLRPSRPELAAKIDACFQALGINPLMPKTPRQAEWFAIVP